MSPSPARPSRPPRVSRKSRCETGLRIQILRLLREREEMQEEIRQLGATVRIYAEILRRKNVDRQSNPH